MKRKIALIVILVLIFYSNIIDSFAYGVDYEYKNKIYLRDFSDIDFVCRMDENDYKEKYDNISIELKRKVTNFIENRKIRHKFENNYKMIQYEINEFLDEHPEYVGKPEVIKDVEMLLFNPVVEIVRTFFRTKEYKLSLMLFNHSLVDSPLDINIDLIDKNYGVELYIKNLLEKDSFFEKIKDFSLIDNNQETIQDSVYAFESGDLYWAIHGFTWKRTRAKYNKAYFKIIDTYDFNKWKDIPGVVAGLSGTNDYNIEIYGLIQNGKLR